MKIWFKYLLWSWYLLALLLHVVIELLIWAVVIWFKHPLYLSTGLSWLFKTGTKQFSFWADSTCGFDPQGLDLVPDDADWHRLYLLTNSIGQWTQSCSKIWVGLFGATLLTTECFTMFNYPNNSPPQACCSNQLETAWQQGTTCLTRSLPVWCQWFSFDW